MSLPPLVQPPSPLRDLLEGQTPEAKQFLNHIQKYNNVFAFTSVGAKIHQSMARGGVYTYRLQGELHHLMGSLLPNEGETPKFVQMYIHDPQMQEDCRLNFIEELHPNILHHLQRMLQDVNPYAQLYENAQRCLSTHPTTPLSLRLVILHNKDSRRYNTPTANEVSAIMVGDGTDTEEKTRDIIIKKKGGPLQRIGWATSSSRLRGAVIVTRQMAASLWTDAAKCRSVAPLQRLKTAAEVTAQTMTRLIE